MKIIYEVLPDDCTDKCDKCRTDENPRMKMHIQITLVEREAITFPQQRKGIMPLQPNLEVTFCTHCLASAVNVASGWDMLKLVERYKTISPRFDNGKPAKKNDNPKRITRHTPDRKGK